MKRILLSILFGALVAVSVSAQTTEFIYQGSLKNSGLPANGNYDFEFALYDALALGNQLGSTVSLNNVVVTNGIFAGRLDFGSQFPGTSRFLEIRVKPTGGGSFTTLTPRQSVDSAPYSVKSLNTDTATNATQLGGVAANQYVVTTDPRMTDARPPTAGSPNYIQNTTSPQASSNFNISGTGTANIFSATTQYNIGGSRLLSVPGTGDLFAGTGAGSANTTGTNNSFFGILAGFSNTTANNNSFFGSGAGQANTTGSDNTLIGRAAGNTNQAGTNNTILGNNADVGSSSLSNATALGAEARVDCSNCMVLGGVAGVNGASTNISVGIGTTSPDTKLEIVNDNGTAPHIFATSYGTSNSAVIGRQADGTFTVPTATTSDRTLLFLGGRGHTGAGFATTSRVGINFEASQDWTATATGTRITFETAANNTATRVERMRINPNGFVGIGTTTPGVTLDVDGNINANLSINAAGYQIGGSGVLRFVGSNNLGVGPNFVSFGGASNNNTFLGYSAGGAANMTGEYNTGLGSITFINGNLSYATAVGAGASVSDSNRIQLGRAGTDTVRIGDLAAASGTHVCINGDNVLSSCSSSRRYKDNIQSMSGGLNLISRLSPVTFDWKESRVSDLGLIAEEVAEVEPLLVTHNKTGAIEGVKYDQLSVVLINAVNEQQTQIEKQQTLIEKQQAMIEQLEKRLEQLEKKENR